MGQAVVNFPIVLVLVVKADSGWLEAPMGIDEEGAIWLTRKLGRQVGKLPSSSAPNSRASSSRVEKIIGAHRSMGQ